MKKLGVCGHFDEGAETSSGQIIKTRIVTDELIRQLGADQVSKVDSHGGIKAMPRMFWQSFKMFKNCESVVMMPAYKGLRVFTPLYSFFNLFFRRKLEYVVIGGWLASFIDEHKWLTGMLKRFDGIFVETTTMKKALESRGFKNVVVMPNFKDLKIIKPEHLKYMVEEPYKLCTFSRVMKEKGIEDAVHAVKGANEQLGRTAFTLDIYGQVDEEYVDRFEQLKAEFPEYIRFVGLVPFYKSVETLRGYFALLFPTFYPGEGFAGTLVDAMAAGVPVVASDWKYNSEIVVPGKNGALIKECNKDKLIEQLLCMAANPEEWNQLMLSTLEMASKYRPERAIEPLMKKING